MTKAYAAYDALVRRRRSCRAFLPDPVPESVLRRVFETAQMTPSNCNVQPWAVHVVSGDAAEAMREALHEAAAASEFPPPDFALVKSYPVPYRDRQIGSAMALFNATGVRREDKAARSVSFLRNFRFFDAPHAAFLFMPDWAGVREAADVGMYAQSLILALTANGLSSCPQGALSFHPDIVRRLLGVDDGMRLLFGIAFGYPDSTHPAHNVQTERLPLEEAVRFHR